MIRMEIIANASVQEDIINSLETKVDGFLYTLLPVVYGRGKNNRKLESTVWPETNFLLIAYVEEEQFILAQKIIMGIKELFPDEGIKVFGISADGNTATFVAKPKPKKTPVANSQTEDGEKKPVAKKRKTAAEIAVENITNELNLVKEQLQQMKSKIEN
ncbi:MAG: PG0541 family transporter-associated protein [Treponemataceae bacterium]